MFAVDLKPFAPPLRKRDVDDVIYEPELDERTTFPFLITCRLWRL